MLWPELAQALREAGISDYSIFFDEETSTLFAVQKQADPSASGALPNLEIMQRWWKHMSDIMEAYPDHSPVCTPLEEVFHMD